MSTVEQFEEEEALRETKYPHLRVMRGGKGPPEGPVVEWLETLAVGTVFACRANSNTVDWDMCRLAHKFIEIYILQIEMPDGKVWERRVDPRLFVKYYRDYKIIAEPKEEAPKGDDGGNSNRTD